MSERHLKNTKPLVELNFWSSSKAMTRFCIDTTANIESSTGFKHEIFICLSLLKKETGPYWRSCISRPDTWYTTTTSWRTKFSIIGYMKYWPIMGTIIGAKEDRLLTSLRIVCFLRDRPLSSGPRLCSLKTIFLESDNSMHTCNAH